MQFTECFCIFGRKAVNFVDCTFSLYLTMCAWIIRNHGGREAIEFKNFGFVCYFVCANIYVYACKQTSMELVCCLKWEFVASF